MSDGLLARLRTFYGKSKTEPVEPVEPDTQKRNAYEPKNLNEINHNHLKNNDFLSKSLLRSNTKEIPSSPSVGHNGAHSTTFPSSIEIPAPNAASIVFCDFETNNVSGCDLTKAGAWRYATDPATAVICFGYRVGGVDYSWTPTGSRDPLDALAADPAAMFACFGGFDQTVWAKIMVERHGFPPIPVGR
jgi:hypothetical protein